MRRHYKNKEVVINLSPKSGNSLVQPEKNMGQNHDIPMLGAHLTEKKEKKKNHTHRKAQIAALNNACC
jgi:hypothetical protein